MSISKCARAYELKTCTDMSWPEIARALKIKSHRSLALAVINLINNGYKKRGYTPLGKETSKVYHVISDSFPDYSTINYIADRVKMDRANIAAVVKYLYSIRVIERLSDGKSINGKINYIYRLKEDAA